MARRGMEKVKRTSREKTRWMGTSLAVEGCQTNAVDDGGDDDGGGVVVSYAVVGRGLGRQ
jgi:hypothetical protein